ncbi:acyloxyacyl hydrolase [Microvirga sp. W0021]|uniref:Acyloxyacyl hydrolase n=1 Tax=Hohaiivirga grylli TaxID=3133970 RepID=A0ABV0BH01_9HYPH
MRVSRLVLGCLTLTALLNSYAMAADMPEQMNTPAFTPKDQSAPNIISELRFGGAAHDPSSSEKGSVDINGEVLFAKAFHSDNPLIEFFIPRLHIGGSINTAGKTSYGYAGFTWTYDITKEIFVEASLGAAIHNGDTGDNVKKHHNALGCNTLFREALGLGYRIDEHWSVMATVDHMSNAGFCSQNRGLTNVGAKIGYTF